MAESTRWGTVWLLILAGVIGGFQVGKAAVAVPVLQAELMLSLFAAAAIVGAYGLLGSIIGLPAALAASLLPAQRTLVAGLIVIGTGGMLGALAPDGFWLFATRALEGLGFLCVIFSAPRLFRLVTARADDQVVFACWSTYMPAGTGIMMLAGPALIAAFGWQGLWLFNGLLPLAYAALVARLDIPGGNTINPSDRNVRANLRESFASPGPILVGLAFGIHTLQYFALSSLLPALLVDRLGLSIAAAGVVSAAAVFANALGNLAAGLLLRRGVPLWIVLAAGFMTSGIAAFGVFNEAMPVVAVAAIATAILAITGLVPASLFAAAPVVAPTSALLAISLGLITQIGISGQLLGPTVLAAFVERFGWGQAPFYFVTAMFAGLALALALRNVLRRKALTAP
jgi:MFS family permease